MESEGWEEFKKAKEYLLSKGFKSIAYGTDGDPGYLEQTEIFVKDSTQVRIHNDTRLGFFCFCEDKSLKEGIQKIAQP